MFTGIVRELGEVASVDDAGDGVRLLVTAPETAGLAAPGDSVAVAGVCLTVVEAAEGRLAFDAVAETLRRSTLGGLEPGARVNVEPALRAGDPLGGHVVQGHVDGVGRVRSLGDHTWFDAPPELLRYCVEKGSIAVDGVSLTVNEVTDRPDGAVEFGLNLIPHTVAVTTLGTLKEGDEVNLEIDTVARYLQRLESLRI